MKRFLIIFLLLWFKFNYGQEPLKIKVKKEFKMDSIFYGVFPIGYAFQGTDYYALIEIKQPNSKEKHYPMGGDFSFHVIKTKNDSTFYKRNTRTQLSLNINDTIVMWAWDPDNSDGPSIGHGQRFGKVSLNQRTNTLNIFQLFYDTKKKKSISRKKQYKVLKWTFYEIIIKEISSPQINRVYYFRRAQPK